MSITWLFIGIGAARAEPVPAGPTLPDPPARRGPPVAGAAGLPAGADLGGVYLWLGPVLGGARVDGEWDSAAGGEVALVRVREEAGLGVAGAAAGASLWSARDGGRVWLEAVAGTRLGGRMYGVTAGPVLELADTQRARVGGAVGAWAYFGVAPYVRAGAVAELGGFVELGVRVALPVLRWR